MIIDLIQDRQNGKPYCPKKFYNDVMVYMNSFKDLAEPIADMLDFGEEIEVKRELNLYIVGNDYNPEICKFVNSVNWL